MRCDILFWLLAILQIGDLVSTYLATRYEELKEINPFFSFKTKKSWVIAILLKIAVLVLFFLGRNDGIFTLLCFAFMNGYYFNVVTTNIWGTLAVYREKKMKRNEHRY